jgi:phosphorylcholine metabolism protein LicD
MVDIFVYDRAYLPNNFLIYIQNRCLKHFFSSKKNGNKRKAAVLKWIAKYLPLPFVYDSSLVNNKRKMKKGKFYFNKNELSKLIKVKFKDMETFIPVGYNAFLKRQYGDYMNDNRSRQHGVDLPDPFTPCNHTEVLHWNNRKMIVLK